MSEYAKNIAKLQEKMTLVATEDILSDQGVLLAKSGLELNKKTCDTILNFKLLKPLENSIAIENQLNAKSIYDHINRIILTNTSIQSLHKKISTDRKPLQKCCLRIEKFPMLQQKLTVLCAQLPDTFDQSIKSAYFAYLCATLDNKSQTEIEEYFLAGLAHDIGFLHIDPNILKKKGNLTPEEWNSIQAHPIIGHKILSAIAAFPKVVSRAVLEHHENIDGTGYPRKKVGEGLGELGQLLNLLDNVIAIYGKKFAAQERSFCSVIPVLQINVHSYFASVSSTIIKMLKHAPTLPFKSSDPNFAANTVAQSESKQKYIQQTTNIIKDTNTEVGFTHNNSEVYFIQNIANNIIFIVNSAGLYGSFYLDDGSDLDKEEKQRHYNELADTLVMLEEVIYQCSSYEKTANFFVNKNPKNPLAAIIGQGLKKIEALPSPDSAPQNGGSFPRTAVI
ncbi:HD-GYP domain-containing protein [Eionea flava]